MIKNGSHCIQTHIPQCYVLLFCFIRGLRWKCNSTQMKKMVWRRRIRIFFHHLLLGTHTKKGTIRTHFSFPYGLFPRIFCGPRPPDDLQRLCFFARQYGTCQEKDLCMQQLKVRRIPQERAESPNCKPKSQESEVKRRFLYVLTRGEIGFTIQGLGAQGAGGICGNPRREEKKCLNPKKKEKWHICGKGTSLTDFWFCHVSRRH